MHGYKNSAACNSKFFRSVFNYTCISRDCYIVLLTTICNMTANHSFARLACMRASLTASWFHKAGFLLTPVQLRFQLKSGTWKLCFSSSLRVRIHSYYSQCMPSMPDSGPQRSIGLDRVEEVSGSDIYLLVGIPVYLYFEPQFLHFWNQ